jgi:uncharacterized protein YndB with AHSA1/START domain
MAQQIIHVEALIHADLDHVWDCWTNPAHIVQWNFAHPSWCCPRASNDVRAGGAFSWRMEARDGSAGFDFSGKYIKTEPQRQLVVTLDDDRSLDIQFQVVPNGVLVSEDFEAENQNPVDMQRAGWQAILNQFKAHCELD